MSELSGWVQAFWSRGCGFDSIKMIWVKFSFSGIEKYFFNFCLVVGGRGFETPPDPRHGVRRDDIFDDPGSNPDHDAAADVDNDSKDYHNNDDNDNDVVYLNGRRFNVGVGDVVGCSDRRRWHEESDGRPSNPGRKWPRLVSF